MGKQLKQKYKNIQLRRITPHVIFFFLRIFGFMAIIAMSVYNSRARKFKEVLPALYKLGKHTSDATRPRKFGTRISTNIVANSSGLIYIFQFNLFQLYLVSVSTVNGNIFGYYLGVVIMLHNALLTLLIPIFSNSILIHGQWATVGVMGFSFLIEAFLSIYLIFLRRYESNLDLFKKIGADKKINDAFFTRKILQSFGPLNVFTASVISGKLFLPPLRLNTQSAYIVLGFIILTYIQQLFISVGFNEENMGQRKIAIALSIIRIPVIVFALVWSLITRRKYIEIKQSIAVFCHIFGDIIIISAIMIYILIQDTKQFGSGLKKILNFRTKAIDLS